MSALLIQFEHQDITYSMIETDDMEYEVCIQDFTRTEDPDVALVKLESFDNYQAAFADIQSEINQQLMSLFVNHHPKLA